MTEKIIYQPVGIIRSGHREPGKTPIQPVFAGGCEGDVEVFPEFADGLKDLEGFSHVILIYHLHMSGKTRLSVKPFLQDVERGVFATRAPCRPNPIGMSVVRLICRDGGTLHVDGMDILDGTPLLDIKPYIARFDRIETEKNGWQDEVDDETARRLGKRGSDK